jgi:PAS domain S-box-containing protein
MKRDDDAVSSWTGMAVTDRAGPGGGPSMPPAFDRRAPAYGGLSRSAGAAVMAIGYLVIIGWLFDAAVLKSVIPGAMPMHFSTALAFIFTGAALWLAGGENPSFRERAVAHCCAGLSALLAGVSLSEYLFGWNVGIDEALVRDVPGVAQSGRMSPQVALGNLLVAVSLPLLIRDDERAIRLGQWLVFAAAVSALFGLSGHLYAAPALNRLAPLGGMALHTVLAFLLLAAGLFVLRPNRGYAAEFTERTVGGFMARRLLPSLIALTLGFSWLYIEGEERRLYEERFGVGLTWVLTVVLFTVLIWRNARLLNRIDGRRERVEAALRRSYEELERRIAERTRELAKANAALQSEIVERRQLREAQERLIEIVEASQDFICMADMTGKVGYINHAGRKMLGFDEAEEVPPMFISDYHTRRTAERVLTEGIPVALRTGAWLGDAALVSRDGREIPVSEMILAHRNSAGEAQFISTVVRDMTSHKRSEAALRESEERFRQFAEHIQDGFWMFDVHNRKLLYVSPAYLRLWDVPAQVLYEDYRQWLRPIHEADRERVARASETQVLNGTYDEEYRIVRADGSICWIRDRGFPIRDASGVYRVAGVAQDITSRKEAEHERERLLASEREAHAEVRRRVEMLAALNAELERSNAELDAFAYVASHDLKEPLRGIHNYACFLLEDHGGKLDADGIAKLQTLMRLTQRMESLINALLHYSHIGRQPLALRPTSLQQALEAALEMVAQRVEESRIEVRVPRPLPTAVVDEALMSDVFCNFIVNAIKYNDRTDKWVEIGYLDAPVEGGQLVFYIRDNGIGIPPKHHASIFRIFKRLHGRDEYGGGTGAGLTIVKKIIERHGGRIWVESAPGEGTTFFFTVSGACGSTGIDAGESDRKTTVQAS